jgi:hypothetical protein
MRMMRWGLDHSEYNVSENEASIDIERRYVYFQPRRKAAKM